MRSVGLAFVLKHKHGQEAIAASWRFLSEATIRMLCEWANYVVVMQAEFARFVPEAARAKLRVVDVGPDHYHSPFHPGLISFYTEVAADWAARNFLV